MDEPNHLLNERPAQRRASGGRPNPPRGMRGPGGKRKPGGGKSRAGEPPAVDERQLVAWFVGALPNDWFEGEPAIAVDRDEIIITGTLPKPELTDADELAVAEASRIASFRELTREQRMTIADSAQASFERIVSWSAQCGDTHVSFTNAAVPAMTRLRFDQRSTLDTLIDAGISRSRSEALAWCVELVRHNEAEWISELEAALEQVKAARAAGPGGS